MSSSLRRVGVNDLPARNLVLAYAQARTAFLEDGVNRVLLASDGG